MEEAIRRVSMLLVASALFLSGCNTYQSPDIVDPKTASPAHTESELLYRISAIENGSGSTEEKAEAICGEIRKASPSARGEITPQKVGCSD